MKALHHFFKLLTLLSWAPLGHTEVQSLVHINQGIHVGRGQTIYVTENELQFNIPKERDSCKVEVVLNEPVTHRVGKFTPQVFNCHFLPDEVKYSHNGSPLLDEDDVMLRVYRFTESETVMETFLLHVQITEPVSSIIKTGSISLQVSEFHGLSNPVDRDVLSFNYPSDKPDTICTVRIVSSEVLAPTHGQVIAGDPKLQKRGDVPDFQQNGKMRTARQEKLPCLSNRACPPGFKEVRFLKANCEDFLEMGLKYQHLSPPSPDVDYIPIRVEIRDEKSRSELQVQNVWIPVRIKGAIPNTHPRAAFMSMYILEVDQFILTPLTIAAVDAEDDETPKSKLVFNITKPPAEGYITHLEDHTKPITSFTWQDLNEMNIAYQPPNSSHTERRNYEVEFMAFDDYFMKSPPIMVHFSIRTAETNAPRVSWNTGLDLLEGQSRPITWENFQIVDNDDINAVRLVTVEGLHHGRLTVRGGKGFMFTIKDIKDRVVRYHHDDSDTTKDYIVFRIFDGRHSIRHKFPINILPKDDSPPFLINNVVFELAEGDTILLEEHMLLASDFDSSDDYIFYRIIKPPKAGEVIKKHFPDGLGLPVTSFMQRDLFHGLIYYHHLGGEIFEDTFDCILSDSHEPPNLSDTQTVMIHIIPVKDQLPKEVSGTMRHLVVKETEVIHITKNHLHFTDTESPENELMYFVTKPCFSPLSSGIYDAGKLFFTDNLNTMKKDPTIPVLKSFTQHAVNHLKVAFMPPQRDIGPEPLFVQFIFSVSDQQGGVVTGLVFNITIIPVDNQIPELMVTDIDTRNSDIRIQLKRKPMNGNSELQGHIMLEGDMFTLEDLDLFKVRYQHDDSETLEDTIVFTATDGFNSADGVLKVQIIPVNDEAPELGAGLKSGLECFEGEQVTITAEYLYATDADSDDKKLTYMIARAPAYGMVQRSGAMVDKFSQLDVFQGLISYKHTGGEIGYSPCMDTVTLIISDGEAGTIDSCCYEGPLPPPVPLHGNLPVYDLNITLMPVNNQLPTISTGEMFIVDEGSSACITLEYLNASDKDTVLEELNFILKTPPQYGYLENALPSPGHEKSNAGINIGSFSLQHLKAGYINYVQSKHIRIEPTADHFMIFVSDGIHVSMAMPLYAIINPANDENPILQLNNITIMEGDICELGPGTLNAIDMDIPIDTLRFSIITPPAHGFLLNGIYGTDIMRYKQMNFAVSHHELTLSSVDMEELKQGMKLMYMHDDTETLQDSFTIQLTDGRHTVQGTLYVHIMPINDEKPQLFRNTGLEVEITENKVISSVAIEAEDKDSPRDKIYYIINNVPKFGQLQLKDMSGWTTLYPGMNFTQEDVDMNRLWYLHTTIMGCKGHDSFHFYVTDGDNNSPSESFYISVKNLDKGDIILLTKPVTLTEGDRVTLTTDVLMATDGTGKPEELMYAVSVPPVHGQIEYINYPGVPISSFSQLDVAAQKVCYVHDNSHEASKDSFSFIISNGLKAKNAMMEFNIEHGDRIPPTLISNKGLQIQEGGMVIISPDVLELKDPDSPQDNLTYIIIQYPRYGTLYLKGSILLQNYFTQADVNNLDISYKHNGGTAELDQFFFIATDKSNQGFLMNGHIKEDPVVFMIQVEHLDKASPKIISKKTPTTIDNLKDGRFAIYITSQYLKASDTDSKDEDLVFRVLRPPYFGYLENANTGSYVRGTFTQKNINQRIIRYIINPSVEVTLDSFEFKVLDPVGNTVVPEIMEIKWSRIEMEQTCYHVCENVGTLAIKVIRTGYSVDPSYIGIMVQEDSARVGLDFTHSTASLIQFDPGVLKKTWNIFIKDDGLEENAEKFKILLKAPKNAILSQKDKATVEVIDLREGNCDSLDFGVKEDIEESVSEIDSRVSKVPGHSSKLPSDSKSKNDQQQEKTFIETDQYLNRYGSPPRGDVPQTDRFLDYRGTLIRDDSAGAIRKQLQAIGSSRLVPPSSVQRTNDETIWTYHGILPLRVEEQFVPQSNIRLADSWSWPAFPFRLTRRHDLPQRDSAKGAELLQSQISTELATKFNKCPSGWTLHAKHCYLLNSERNATWESAENTCKQMLQGHLTSIHSKKEMKWLWRFAKKQSFWIGMTDKGKAGRWVWTNGRPVSFSKMKQRKSLAKETAQPNCILVEGKNKWVPRKCNQSHSERYICSISASSP
nr:PREDICTED: FRAS1-related extracellular matrix protein 1-like [Latimeria chalumnae]|eukprot:XP_006002762.1 PREDICTED: FRAS1-related extracellular matrix protein 1-like [Latimeria chalumnae]